MKALECLPGILYLTYSLHNRSHSKSFIVSCLFLFEVLDFLELVAAIVINEYNTKTACTY